MCKNFILNGLTNDLYDYCNTMSTTKKSMECPTEKYDTEEVGSKKYSISRYTKFQMSNDRFVEVQSHEKIIHEIISEDINLYEQFQVSALTNKVSPSWKDFKNTLRHKINEFSLEI